MLKAIASKTGQVTPEGKLTTELKALLLATGATLLGLLLQVVAVSTTSWVILHLPGQGVYSNATGRWVTSAYSGLWRLCRVEVVRKVQKDGFSPVESEHSECEPHNLFPSEDDIQRNKNFNQQHLEYDVKDLIKIDYTRTAIAFTIIALVLAAIGHGFAFYTIRRPRYIIKRLTALLHFMTAACILVLNEVFTKTSEHEKDHLPNNFPSFSSSSYGYSFVLSWIVFVLFVLAGLVFLFLSHKRKAEYADDEDEGLEDEPMHLGRN